jgi:hypothetical protein
MLWISYHTKNWRLRKFCAEAFSAHCMCLAYFNLFTCLLFPCSVYLPAYFHFHFHTRKERSSWKESPEKIIDISSYKK